ncbi:MAG: hypothetical protein ACKOXF_04570 [Chitinophagaceae bacterium]
MKSSFNRILYIGFVLLGIYQTLVSKDYMQAAASLGIALAFDLFDQQQKWQDRPIWQKAILLLHLTLIGVLFALTFIVS